ERDAPALAIVAQAADEVVAPAGVFLGAELRGCVAGDDLAEQGELFPLEEAVQRLFDVARRLLDRHPRGDADDPDGDGPGHAEEEAARAWAPEALAARQAPQPVRQPQRGLVEMR